ncbi:MAG: hypothetical protein LBG92_09040 [Prevotellaceae bacterium]|nr:hypothetical protein [Prevotellaceae bacterium]
MEKQASFHGKAGELSWKSRRAFQKGRRAFTKKQASFHKKAGELSQKSRRAF